MSDKKIWIDAEDERKALSPRQMLSWVRRLGFGLDRLGVRKGEVVMIYTPNHIFVPAAYQGIVGSGRIFSGANPVYTLTEMEYQIKNTETTVILAHPSLIETAVEAARRVGLAKNRIFQFSDEPCAPLDGVVDWRKMIGSESDGESWHWDDMTSTARQTIATINYSSGTTGLPKGVCVSHFNLVANCEQTIYIRDQETSYSSQSRPEERWIGFLPLYHAYGKCLRESVDNANNDAGQMYANIMAQKLGNPMYIMQKFVFEQFLAIIQTRRITHLQVAPPILIMLDKRSETSSYDLSSVRNILCGAAPLSKELQNSIQRRFKLNVVQGWGMTETTSAAMHVPGGRYDDSGSVGLLDPNTECKLIGDDGQVVPPGEPGEMHVRGPQICLGYWRKEEATRESLDSDGWLKTGDVAIVRGDMFWIVDRKKELIKVNALQVAPAELEAVLLENSDIEDVGVVGITLDEQEWPRAYVQLKDQKKGAVSEEDIQEYMRGRVAKHKFLVGGVKFVKEVPRLASGKLDRKVIKKWSKQDAIALGHQRARL